MDRVVTKIPLSIGRTHMSMVMELSKRFFRDEKAAEVTELGIVLALIVAGAVASIALIGPIIQAAYADTAAALAGP